MPVACQSCAPECPQAFGRAKRGLRGLRPLVADNPSVTAAPCHLPLHKGGYGLVRCHFVTLTHGWLLGVPAGEMELSHRTGRGGWGAGLRLAEEWLRRQAEWV